MTTTDNDAPPTRQGEQPRGSLLVTLAHEAVDAITLPEAVTVPHTPAEIWDHARRGEWTTATGGPKRVFACLWAVGAITISVAVDTAKWVACPTVGLGQAINHPRTPGELWARIRTSEWGISAHPVQRYAATGWAAVVTAFAVVGDTTKWVTQRFTRLCTVTAAALLIGTGIAQVPVLGGLIPTLLNITAW